MSSYFPAKIGSNQQSAEAFLDKPTRGDNILDLILTSNEALVNNINIEEPFVSSDHCVVKI